MYRKIQDESAKDFKNLGYKTKKFKKYAISSSEMQDKLGNYYIINAPLLHKLGKSSENYLKEIISRRLKRFIKGNTRLLIVGLGNPELESDSLGDKVVKNIGFIDGNVCIYCFLPNVFINTGIESLFMIKSIVSEYEIELVIIIDSLLTDNLKRLGVSFQINTFGLTPGSALHNLCDGINKNSVNAECLAIGVPLMFSSDAENILAPMDIEDVVNRCAKIISDCIVSIL